MNPICTYSTNQNLNISLISQEFLETAKKLVLENRYTVEKGYSDEHFRFHHGEFGTVFSYVDFPGFTMQVMSKDFAEICFKNMETAREIVKERSLDTCFIPKAERIPLSDDETLFVMDLPFEMIGGVDEYYYFEMVSECEYELFDKPEYEFKWEKNFIDYELVYKQSEVKSKWHKYFIQAAELVAMTGYWHASWCTILLDKDCGFSFINFESTEPTPHCIKLGIEGLLKIAPHDFYDEIASIAKNHGVSIDVAALKKNRKAILEMKAGIRKCHKAYGVTQNSGVMNTHLLDSNSDRDACEEGVVARLSECVKFTGRANLVKHRMLSYQPLAYSGYTRSRFEAILRNLWNKKIIFAYTFRRNECGYENLSVYNIYF